ncbi:ribosomal-processing cysteine protease Prp [Clostridium tunisiense]|uniref:ribosomal-processing cysteine protease Prp n=1 Tax=Clostridium tunisiense TaxID=219748 RepID=UPI00030B29DC|nr:ribosomal-processing cysteine protease Prp [Clostridium tunisiense]
MTNVKFYKKSDKLIGFNMYGHAAPRELDLDVDLTCAAISAISQTTLIGILEVLKIEVTYKIEDGFLSLTLNNQSNEDVDRCQVLLETMLLGLKSIEFTYGDYIKVELEEV